MNNVQRKIDDIHEVTNQKLQKSAFIINKEDNDEISESIHVHTITIIHKMTFWGNINNIIHTTMGIHD